MGSDIVVAAKDEPEAKPVEAKEPHGPNKADEVHYSDLNVRMAEQLRNFRLAGEALGLLLVENIKFNRDKLAEFFDKFESISESIPDVDEVLKACEDLDGFKKRMEGSLVELETKLAGQVTAMSETVTGLLASQQEKSQRNSETVDLTSLTALVNMVRDQVVDLNNRFSAMHDRFGLVDQCLENLRADVVNRHTVLNALATSNTANTDRRFMDVLGRLQALEAIGITSQLRELGAQITRVDSRLPAGRQTADEEGGAS